MKRTTKPIRVFYSELSQRFYATRAWKTVKRTNDAEIIEVTGEKFDVTDDIGRIMEKFGVTFTPLKPKEAEATTIKIEAL